MLPEAGLILRGGPADGEPVAGQYALVVVGHANCACAWCKLALGGEGTLAMVEHVYAVAGDEANYVKSRARPAATAQGEVAIVSGKRSYEPDPKGKPVKRRR